MTARLTITAAGTEKEQDALAPGSARLPKIEKFVIGAGPVQDNLYLATEMTAWHEAPVLSVEKISEGGRQYTCHLGTEVEGRIRELGLLMDDGTLYAYGPWQPEIDGEFKPGGTAYTLYALIARENLVDLEVKYSPLDVTQLGQQIAADATARISVSADEINHQLIIWMSRIDRDVLRVLDMMNTERTKNV